MAQKIVATMPPPAFAPPDKADGQQAADQQRACHVSLQWTRHHDDDDDDDDDDDEELFEQFIDSDPVDPSNSSSENTADQSDLSSMFFEAPDSPRHEGIVGKSDLSPAATAHALSARCCLCILAPRSIPVGRTVISACTLSRHLIQNVSVADDAPPALLQTLLLSHRAVSRWPRSCKIRTAFPKRL